MAIAASDMVIAYLFVGSECRIQVSGVTLDVCAVDRIPYPCVLSMDKGWLGLCAAGPYIVAWGYSESRGKNLVRALR